MSWSATPAQELPARDELRDLAAGLRGFPEGLWPSGRRSPDVTVAATRRPPMPSDQRGPRRCGTGKRPGDTCPKPAPSPRLLRTLTPPSPHIPQPMRALPCERILRSGLPFSL